MQMMPIIKPPLRPDGTGSFLAMKGALAKSGLQPSDINYTQPVKPVHKIMTQPRAPPLKYYLNRRIRQ